MTNATASRPPYQDINVLVYHHQPAGTPVVEKGLAIIHTNDLAEILTANPELKLNHKAITAGARHVKVVQSDLWSEDGEKDANKHLPNANSFLANVKVPWKVWVKSVALGVDKELVILSQRPSSQS